jgi:hypothetical protein
MRHVGLQCTHQEATFRAHVIWLITGYKEMHFFNAPKIIQRVLHSVPYFISSPSFCRCLWLGWSLPNRVPASFVGATGGTSVHFKSRPNHSFLSPPFFLHLSSFMTIRSHLCCCIAVDLNSTKEVVDDLPRLLIPTIASPGSRQRPTPNEAPILLSSSLRHPYL